MGVKNFPIPPMLCTKAPAIARQGRQYAVGRGYLHGRYAAPLFCFSLWGSQLPHTPCDTSYRLWVGDRHH